MHDTGPQQVIVAALLLDDSNRLLLATRPEGRKYAGLWEFPGGKIEPGETEPQALARELQEELGLQVDKQHLTRSPLTILFNEGSLRVHLYECRQWLGTPSPKEGQIFAWVAAHELEQRPIMSGIRAVLPQLQQHYPTHNIFKP